MSSSPISREFATHGKVTDVRDDGRTVVFAPRGTSYEMHLKTADGKYDGPTNTPVEALVHVTARKVWTVPSGGNFISPIMGTPKIIQGRVRQADEKQLVMQAGATFVVDLPGAEHAVDLPSGPITIGNMVNVTALPGATIEIIGRHAPSASPSVARVGVPGDAPDAVR